MKIKSQFDNDIMDRQKLIDLGIIIEDVKTVLKESDEGEDPEDSAAEMTPSVDENDQFPNVDYDIQNEIIKFFVNNPGGDPELFRQYATSIGIDPDEFQRQENILLSQLLKIYTQDSENMGYGSALTDDEVDDEIANMVTPNSAAGGE